MKFLSSKGMLLGLHLKAVVGQCLYIYKQWSKNCEDKMSSFFEALAPWLSDDLGQRMTSTSLKEQCPVIHFVNDCAIGKNKIAQTDRLCFV